MLSSFTFSFYDHYLLLFCIYTVAASKTQIRIRTTAVQDPRSQTTTATRKYPEGICQSLKFDRFWRRALIWGKKSFFGTVEVEGFSFPKNKCFDARFQNKFVFQNILHIPYVNITQDKIKKVQILARCFSFSKKNSAMPNLTVNFVQVPLFIGDFEFSAFYCSWE